MVGVCLTALLQVGKNCFCMSRSCSSLFGIGGGILVSASRSAHVTMAGKGTAISPC